MSLNLSPQLKQEWYQKLADHGFKDIEDDKGNLKQYDRRTQTFDDRDSVRHFFVRLDHFLTEHPELPELHQQILSLYSEGKYIGEICDRVLKGRTKVKEVIYYYKKLLIKDCVSTCES